MASGSLLLLTLSFLSCITLNIALSTFTISETSNQTLICAFSYSRDSVLNCSSFPREIRIPAVSSNVSSYSGMVAGDGFQCLLSSPSSSSSSVMRCYRFGANGTNLSSKRIYIGPALDHLTAGNSHVCGIVRNGTNRLECWQWDGFNTTDSRIVSGVSVGEDFVCGLSETGSISCLGTNFGVISSVPEGNYSLVSAGFRHACAVSLSNSNLICWGEMAGEKPEGRFVDLALGENRSCARRTNETVVCWGENDFSLPVSLQGTHFVEIEAKRSVFCGVESSNFSLYCWGNDMIFQNSLMVFENVMPRPCRNVCPCGPLAGSGSICPQGSSICQDCDLGSGPSSPPTLSLAPPAPQPQTGSTSGFWNGKMVPFFAVGCVGSLCMVALCFYSLFRCYVSRGCRVHDSGPMEDPPVAQRLQTEQNPSQNRAQSTLEPKASHLLEKRLSNLASMGSGTNLEEFSLQTLVQATDNFSEDNKVGIGSFGSVYRATLADGREVAIKRAEISTPSLYVADATRRQENQDSAFVHELESLSRLNHKHLVRLLGYCEDCNELALVYEYMSNGTLHDHIHKLKSSPLMSWTTRLKVALDAARGVEYLHVYSVPPLIHRDIKSSNILLDSTWTAKVSDFGLSLMGPNDEDSHLSLHAAGTVGYIDPEYYRLQHLTTKSDVYSFGVVLLELLSGYRAIHKNENGDPRNVVDFIVPYIVQDEIHRVLDPNVPPPTPFEIEAVSYIGYLAADCVTLEGRDRPSMTEVVNNLERALAACLAHQTFSGPSNLARPGFSRSSSV